MRRRRRSASRSSASTSSRSSRPSAPVGGAIAIDAWSRGGPGRCNPETMSARRYDRTASEAKERGDGNRRGGPKPRSANRRGCEGARPLFVVGTEPDRPDPGGRGRGASFLGLRGQALSGLRLAARQRLDRPPAPEDHPGDQGPGRPALHDRPAARERVALDARPAARRSDPGRPVRLVLHERRRRGQRERREACAARHGPSQDHRALPLLPRCDEWLGHAHGRSSSLGGRAGHAGRRAHVRPVHVSLPGRPSRSVSGLHRRAAPRGDPRVRGGAHRRRGDPRDGDGDERRDPAPRRVPQGDPRGVRPARHPR